MKRQVQKTGVRKYFGADLVELQSEPLAALDAFFAEYGPCVVQGCEVVENDNGTYDVAAGLAALTGVDPEGVERVMLMPFPGASGVAMPLYLTAHSQAIERVYGDGKVKPIAYVYTAQAAGVQPDGGTPYLILTAEGGNRFVDAVQDPAHRFVSDADRARWNRILEQAKEYADSVAATGSEAALRTAKAYTDTRETAILATADAKDAEMLRTAKAYADTVVTALAGSAPETLDTLQELAAALGNDPNFATTVMQMIGERVTVEALNGGLAECLRFLGMNADISEPVFGMGFQYDTGGSGTVGPFISAGYPGYPLQLVCGYWSGNGGHQNLKFRTRNGDGNVWNPWYTIYSDGNLGPATAAANGLMSAADKQKIDNLPPKIIAGSVYSGGVIRKGNGNFSAEKIGDYLRIHHNLGHTNYIVTATAFAEGNTTYRDNVVTTISQTSNFFELAVTNGSGAIERCTVDFVLACV